METKFKASELNIVRPLKLVKIKTWRQLAFPYNILAKLGLIAPDDLRAMLIEGIWCSSRKLTIEDRIKAKIQRKVPRFLYRAALNKRKQTFHLLTENITIAQKRGYTDYRDVFTGEKLTLYNPNVIYPDFHEVREAREKAIINTEYISSLIPCIYKEEVKNFPYSAKEISFDARYSLMQQIVDSELTIEQLEKLKSIIIAAEQDKEIIFEHEHTDRYVDPVFNRHISSYDINGKSVSPTVKNKVKERKLTSL